MRALLLLLVAACASSPREAVPNQPPPIPDTRDVATAAVNPVGEFEFSTMTPEGIAVKGVMTIRGTPGSYTGSINAGPQGTFPVKGVTVDGQTMTIASDHPEGGPMELRLTFVGNEFTGAWHVGGQSGEVTGRRKAG